jgi:starvation-inducible DNA-binding protein
MSDFKIYTNALKAYEDEFGGRVVTGTTSSTIRDLHGDEMTYNALKSMEHTAKQNMTIWLNHEYKVPDDLFGSVTDARIVKRIDETGQEVYDLDVDIKVCPEEENPEAMRAFRAIKRGVKLGLSIGARVERVTKRKDQHSGEESYVIDSVKLMEASVVGIPANQRSYLQNAVKSLRGAAVDEIKAEGGLRVGDMVSWSSSGGTARGKITKIVREGSIKVPGSSFTINAEDGDPAVLIRVYRDDKPTDTIVGHKMSTLRAAKSYEVDDVKAVEVEGQASADKAPLIGALYNLLAEATAFYLKAHGAHWNVVGEEFAQYHELFGEIYEDVHGSLDPIAENLRKLNSAAPFELKDLARMTNDAPQAEDYEAESLAANLYAANESLLENIMVAFKAATDANQQGIANFLAERQDMHQKWSWQLRASLAEEPEEAEEAGESAETEKAAGKIQFGSYVSWTNVEGKDGVGEVEQVVKEGTVMVPKSNETLEAKAGDPAVLVRVWLPTESGYKPTGTFMAFNASQLKTIKKPSGSETEKPDATTVPGLEIVDPNKRPEGKSLEVKNVDIENTQTPAEVEAPVEVVEETAAEEVTPAVEALQELGAELVKDTDLESARNVAEAVQAPQVVVEAPVAEAVAVEAPAAEAVAEEEAVEPVEAPAESDIETSEKPEEAVSGDKSADTADLAEVAEIAKSALDAALAAQAEVIALKKSVTEVLASKAKVEAELEKTLDLVGRLIDVPVGHVPAIKRASGEMSKSAPWLSPYIQRVLETQE